MARHALRRDSTEKDIVAALRKIGCKVYILGLPLDLLVWHRGSNGIGRTLLVEVKVEGGRYTKQQIEFMAEWPGEVHTVRTPEEAVAKVIGKEAMR